jgi:hypothetical protein
MLAMNSVRNLSTAPTTLRVFVGTPPPAPPRMQLTQVGPSDVPLRVPEAQPVEGRSRYTLLGLPRERPFHSSSRHKLGLEEIGELQLRLIALGIQKLTIEVVLTTLVRARALISLRKHGRVRHTAVHTPRIVHFLPLVRLVRNLQRGSRGRHGRCRRGDEGRGGRALLGIDVLNEKLLGRVDAIWILCPASLLL